MRIESITVKNFRGYKEETKIYFDNLTLIVGKNDIGKSTILEAADVFFENRKVDSADLNINCDKDEDRVEIALEFSEFPEEIDLDAGAKTNLMAEFLLNSSNNLQIKKVFTPGSTVKPKVFLLANMPVTGESLVSLKNTELKTKVKALGIDESKYSANINNSIRKAIWDNYDQSELAEQYIDINKEDGKKIYEKLEQEFPIYTLFSADRKNTDQDDEIQAPIKASIKELMRTLNDKLEPIKKEVLEKLDEISEGTIKKLEEMNPEVAKSLKSVADKPAWEKAFNINIESDGVPLNKRGSGVKRLVLINYFRQEAERKKNESSKVNVFYAIEEPETSQHPDWQIKLFEAFKELTEDNGVQIALTSHHPELCGLVKLENVRFAQRYDDKITIKNGDESNYKEIGNTLGVLPKLDGVKVIVCVEGPKDVTFLQNLAHIYELDSNNSSVLWVPLGGGTLRDYVEKGYLEVLNLPQIYLFDRDPDNKYKDQVEKLKKNDNCWAELTKMLTIENYIHPKLYKKIWPELNGNFVDLDISWIENGWSERNIPTELSGFIRDEYENGNTALKNYGKDKIKTQFAEIAAKEVLKEDLEEMGVFQELEEFYNAIKKYL